MMLETERLILREYSQDYFDALYEILSDEQTMKHYPKPYDKKGVQRWIDWSLDNYQKYGFGLWAIVLKETGEFIGDCGITLQNIDGEQLPEIGYHVHKHHWRKGYAKEAASAVRDWAFRNTPYTTLYSYMTSTNIASYSTAISIGMSKVKEYNDNNNIPHVVYKMTKDEWKQKHNKKKVKLMSVIQALEDASEYNHFYYNKNTGEIEAYFPELDRREALDKYLDDCYIGLPDQYDIHEYSMMEKFAYTLETIELLNALKGRGAFRRFKDTVIRLGVISEWYTFRDKHYKQVAIDWCEDHGISYDSEEK